MFAGLGSLAIWREPDRKDDTGFPLWPWLVHKWSFNGLGAFAGWWAAYLLYTRLEAQNGANVTSGDYILALVAMLGLSGWLPRAVAGFAMAFGNLAQKASEAVTKAK